MGITSVLAFGLGMAWSASATAITLDALAVQTVAGENFVFNLGPAPLLPGGGVFTISARGDYSPTVTFLESLDLTIENLALPGLGTDNADSAVIFTFDDVQWERSFTLTNAQVAALIADGVVEVSVDLVDEINIITPASFVAVRFSYGIAPVHAPPALALFGLATALIGLRRRN